MKNLLICILFPFVLYTAEAQEKQFMLSKNNISDEKLEKHQLALVSLQISKSEIEYNVALTKVSIINTEKSVSQQFDKWNENDFVCFILDEDNQILDTILIFQPLRVRYEYPTEDKSIGVTTMELSENEVLLRFAYSINMKYLNIAKIGKNGELESIETLPLVQTK